MAPLLVFLLVAVGLMVAEVMVPVHGGLSLLLILVGLMLWGRLPTAYWPHGWVLLGFLGVLWLVTVVVASLRNRKRRAWLGGAEMIGTIGLVIVAGPPLRVHVRGENWQAEAEAEAALVIGDRVRVGAVHGLTLEVTAVSSGTQQSSTTPGAL